MAGLIVPDCPIDESGPLARAAEAAGLDLVALAAPTSGPERLRRIARASRGFVYLVPLTGITGERTEVPAELVRLVRDLRARHDQADRRRLRDLDTRPGGRGRPARRRRHRRQRHRPAGGAPRRAIPRWSRRSGTSSPRSRPPRARRGPPATAAARWSRSTAVAWLFGRTASRARSPPRASGPSARPAGRSSTGADVEKNAQTCPRCGQPFRLSARERLDLLLDPGLVRGAGRGAPLPGPARLQGQPRALRRPPPVVPGEDRPRGRPGLRRRPDRRAPDRRVHLRVRVHGRQHGLGRGREDHAGDRAGHAQAHPAAHRDVLGRRPDAGGRAVADADGQDRRRRSAGSPRSACRTSSSSRTRRRAG